MATTKKAKPKTSGRKMRDLPSAKKPAGNVKGGRVKLWID